MHCYHIPFRKILFKISLQTFKILQSTLFGDPSSFVSGFFMHTKHSGSILWVHRLCHGCLDSFSDSKMDFFRGSLDSQEQAGVCGTVKGLRHLCQFGLDQELKEHRNRCTELYAWELCRGETARPMVNDVVHSSFRNTERVFYHPKTHLTISM